MRLIFTLKCITGISANNARKSRSRAVKSGKNGSTNKTTQTILKSMARLIRKQKNDSHRQQSKRKRSSPSITKLTQKCPLPLQHYLHHLYQKHYYFKIKDKSYIKSRMRIKVCYEAFRQSSSKIHEHQLKRYILDPAFPQRPIQLHVMSRPTIRKLK